MVTTPAAGYVSLLATIYFQKHCETYLYCVIYFSFSLFQLSDVLSEPIALSISGNIFMALVSENKSCVLDSQKK